MKSGMMLFFAFFCPYFLLFSLFASFTLASCQRHTPISAFLFATAFAWNSLSSNIPMPRFITFSKSLIKSPLLEIFVHPSFFHPQQPLFFLTLLYSQWMLRTFDILYSFLFIEWNVSYMRAGIHLVHCYPYLLKYCLNRS